MGMLENWASDGYGVLKNAIDVERDAAALLPELVKYHESATEDDLFNDRYCHEPKLRRRQACLSLLWEMGEIAEKILGRDNTQGGDVPQLLGTVGTKAPLKMHERAHIDNVTNCIDELIKEEAALAKAEIGQEERARREAALEAAKKKILYPGFNFIMGLFLTRGQVRVYPGSHLEIAAFYRTSDDMYDLLKRVNKEVVEPFADKPGVVLDCQAGDVVIMNALLVHGAANPLPEPNPKWNVPGKGPLAARLYRRYGSINPVHNGLERMRDPWKGF